MCSEAFFELKKRLLSTSTVYTVINLGCIVDTDASGERLGAVISQVVDVWCPM